MLSVCAFVRFSLPMIIWQYYGIKQKKAYFGWCAGTDIYLIKWIEILFYADLLRNLMFMTKKSISFCLAITDMFSTLVWRNFDIPINDHNTEAV